MRSGIAGISIVSAYITIVAIQLSMASTFQAEAGILTELDEGGNDDEYVCESEYGLLSLVLLVFLVFL
jgi:hypothetical protein